MDRTVYGSDCRKSGISVSVCCSFSSNAPFPFECVLFFLQEDFEGKKKLFRHSKIHIQSAKLINQFLLLDDRSL